MDLNRKILKQIISIIEDKQRGTSFPMKFKITKDSYYFYNYFLEIKFSDKIIAYIVIEDNKIRLLKSPPKVMLERDIRADDINKFVNEAFELVRNFDLL